MDIISAYAIPSISAISIKFLMIWYGRAMLVKANFWLWSFLLGLLGVNIAELGLFSQLSKPYGSIAYLTMTFYYLFAVISSTTYLALALKFAGKFGVLAKYLVILLTLMGIVVLAIPGLAIDGVESIGYSLTRVAGPMYWVLQIVIVGSLLISILMLVYASKWQKNWLAQRRAVALLIATGPVVICVVGVIVSMQLGVKFNATVIVSFAINILLGILIYTEYEHRLFRFLSLVPTTNEFKLTHQAANAAYLIKSGSLTQAVLDFERALILDALNKCQGNKTTAAQLLGISRTTLRRKLEGPTSK